MYFSNGMKMIALCLLLIAQSINAQAGNRGDSLRRMALQDLCAQRQTKIIILEGFCISNPSAESYYRVKTEIRDVEARIKALGGTYPAWALCVPDFSKRR